MNAILKLIITTAIPLVAEYIGKKIKAMGKKKKAEEKSEAKDGI